MKDDQVYQTIKIGHPKHFDEHIGNHNSYIRETIAERGSDQHREKLLHDPNKWVRAQVADKGNEKQAKRLLRDDDESVRICAFGRLGRLGVV